MVFERGYINPDHSSQLLGCLSRLWHNQKLCDAVVHAGATKMKVHKLVLMASSPALLTLCESIPSDRQLEVKLPSETSREALLCFLTYLYEGLLQLKTDIVLEVQKIASYFKIENIQNFCKDYLEAAKQAGIKVAEAKIESDAVEIPCPKRPFLTSKEKFTVLNKMIKTEFSELDGSVNMSPDVLSLQCLAQTEDSKSDTRNEKSDFTSNNLIAECNEGLVSEVADLPLRRIAREAKITTDTRVKSESQADAPHSKNHSATEATGSTFIEQSSSWIVPGAVLRGQKSENMDKLLVNSQSASDSPYPVSLQTATGTVLPLMESTQKAEIKRNDCSMYFAMPEKRNKKQIIRAQWTEESMRLAVHAVLNDQISLKTAGKRFGVPRTTLRRHIERAQQGQSVTKRLGRSTVLSADQEKELVAVIVDQEQKLFALTRTDVRRFVYDFCLKHNIHHPFNRETKMAGRDWVELFLKRHKEIAIKKPKPNHMTRADGFNKVKVERFFEVLHTVLFRNGKQIIPDANIYNTGFTFCLKPIAVMGERGKYNFGAVSKTEKGNSVTVFCAMSAVGVFVPPMLIFPRTETLPQFMGDLLPGAIDGCSPGGSITEELFEKWFDHFLEFAKPKTCQNPTLLILDGHASHRKNLAVIVKSRDNNVIMLSLPSRCSHKMQPLDCTIFKNINSFYYHELELWLRMHQKQAITEYEIGKLFARAYTKAATVDRAVTGFRMCGIIPYNPDVFSDEQFVGVEVSVNSLGVAEFVKHGDFSETTVADDGIATGDIDSASDMFSEATISKVDMETDSFSTGFDGSKENSQDNSPEENPQPSCSSWWH